MRTSFPVWPLLPIALLIPVVVYLGMNVGSWEMSFGEVWQATWGPEGLKQIVIRDLRLPRVLLAMLSGGILSLGGYLMQALVRNPLADPYILGLSAGAGFGANLRILGLLGAGLTGALWLPVFAFGGALLSLLLLLAIGFRNMQHDTSRLLIAGIAISSLFMALTGYLIINITDLQGLQAVIDWSFGSFVGADWLEVLICLGLFLFLAGASLLLHRQLDLLAVGEAQAIALGLKVGQFKLLLLGITALGVGGSIAFTGPIGFVGLMIPHFCRGLLGGRHLPNLIYGPLVGAIYLGGCDVMSQVLYHAPGLPVGIVTALLGVPFFLYLLMQGNRGLFGR